ncbi:hypothetical protein Ssi03_47230 [Sphaerisporangium siamense]|uniref:D,D-heptose 1,7-bisphosphate phosphatase n=1 Tax=Sphaerisporangium siamense TaxID=795645 RepID=A0A7W7D4G1_9ACTN|nr:HAD family hydrolase [Sphaerisporangium siamense]MBB4699140.1 HAD superfamily hydrolase (TIGR01662 family) [Sphaerisporangium siamense]GII86733.1 hypothetical protein Ssi03_47230 [Sphaerisporangium siamense]
MGVDLPAAVLFDRDGTLVKDVPYNTDPARVEPMPGARAALDRLRAASVPVGVVTNQSGVAKGLITPAQLDAVNRRVEDLLGPFAIWAVCPHDDGDGCPCRKPAPGLILRAAAVLGVAPRDCVVIGDIARDMNAAHAAGARGILVPTPETLPPEVTSAAEVAADLPLAVEMALTPRPTPPPPTCPPCPDRKDATGHLPSPDTAAALDHASSLDESDVAGRFPSPDVAAVQSRAASPDEKDVAGRLPPPDVAAVLGRAASPDEREVAGRSAWPGAEGIADEVDPATGPAASGSRRRAIRAEASRRRTTFRSSRSPGPA